jgi:hypothetical protein
MPGSRRKCERASSGSIMFSVTHKKAPYRAKHICFVFKHLAQTCPTSEPVCWIGVGKRDRRKTRALLSTSNLRVRQYFDQFPLSLFWFNNCLLFRRKLYSLARGPFIAQCVVHPKNAHCCGTPYNLLSKTMKFLTMATERTVACRRRICPNKG